MDKNKTQNRKRMFLTIAKLRAAQQLQNGVSTQGKNSTLPQNSITPTTATSNSQAKPVTSGKPTKKKTLLQIATDYEKEKQARLKSEAKQKAKLDGNPTSNGGDGDRSATNRYELLQDWRPSMGHICLRCGQSHPVTEECTIC